MLLHHALKLLQHGVPITFSTNVEFLQDGVASRLLQQLQPALRYDAEIDGLGSGKSLIYVYRLQALMPGAVVTLQHPLYATMRLSTIASRQIIVAESSDGKHWRKHTGCQCGNIRRRQLQPSTGHGNET